MSKLFRAERWLTVAQLTGAWSFELAESGEDPKQCEQNLVHILMEDILNGRLDDSGPLVDGRRLGLRLITPENRAAFIEGPQLLEEISARIAAGGVQIARTRAEAETIEGRYGPSLIRADRHCRLVAQASAALSAPH